MICQNIFKVLSIQNHKSWGAELLRESSPPTMGHMSRVTCHVSLVPCQVEFLFVLFFGQRSRGSTCYQRGLPCLVLTDPGLPGLLRQCSPPTTCHMSRVTCHMSCVTCHMSCVTCQIFYLFFFTKGWSLAGEGLLSTGPTLSSFNKFWYKCTNWNYAW